MPPVRLSRALLRRWYLVVAGLLVTVLGCIATTALVPAQYEAQAVVLLLPPNGPTGDNPYLNLGSLSGLNVVLDQALGSADSIAMVHSKGIAGTYAIADANGSAGPLVEVTGQADTAGQARRITSFVAQLVPQTLRSLQNAAGVTSDKAYITSMVLNPVGKATPVTKRQTRALIAVGAAGILLTIVLVALAERIAVTRSVKAGESTHITGDDTDELVMANGHDHKLEDENVTTEKLSAASLIVKPLDIADSANNDSIIPDVDVAEEVEEVAVVAQPAKPEKISAASPVKTPPPAPKATMPKIAVARKPQTASADPARDAASTKPPAPGGTSGAASRSVRVRRVRPATKAVRSSDTQPAPRTARG